MTRRSTRTAWARIGMLAAAFGYFAVVGTAVRAQEFSYSGDEGPGFWGELTEEWENCATDMRQSPIDIDKARQDATLRPLSLKLHATKIHLTNNGHTIEQEYASEKESTLRFEGVKYTLSQFHFHTLSEHTIDGDRGVMELHAVFSNDATGNKAVVGQLYKIGKKNAFLAQFNQMLPQKNGDITESDTEINPADGLKNTKDYHTYPGSLTTPPCSPTVT